VPHIPAALVATSPGLHNALSWVLRLYVFILFARALVSWFPITPGTPMETVVRVLERLTEPVLRPIRRLVPPVRMGGGALDLSIIIAIFGLYLIGGLVISYV
jgi:YggT family protein